MNGVDKERSGFPISGNGQAPEGGATVGNGKNGGVTTDREYAKEFFNFAREVCQDPKCCGLHDVDKLVHQELAHLSEDRRNRICTLLHTQLQESAHKARRLERHRELIAIRPSAAQPITTPSVLTNLLETPPSAQYQPPLPESAMTRVPQPLSKMWGESKKWLQTVLSLFPRINPSQLTNGSSSRNGIKPKSSLPPASEDLSTAESSAS